MMMKVYFKELLTTMTLLTTMEPRSQNDSSSATEISGCKTNQPVSYIVGLQQLTETSFFVHWST